MDKNLSRRDFLKGVGLAVLTPGLLPGAVLARQEKRPEEAAMPLRTLGKTGRKVSLLAYGTADFPNDPEKAEKCLNRAIDLGVNYLDTAPSYRGGKSEEYVGRVMKTRRKEVYLATKTLARDKRGAAEELKRSLERLQTDHLDCLQFHAIGSFMDVDKIFGTGGAIEGVEEWKRQGLIKHIGFTGHRRPEVLREMLKRYDKWGTVLMPISAPDSHLYDFGTDFLDDLVKANIGVIAMKVLEPWKIAHGKVEDPEPALRYAWTHKISCSIIGMYEVAHVEQNVLYAKRFKPMSSDEMAALRAKTEDLGKTAYLWWKR